MADPRLSEIASAHLDGALSFADAVALVVVQVPAGRVCPFGGVAALVGRPRHARQVGRVMARLPPGTTLPWWRVLRADGSLPMGELQRARLAAEGVTFHGERVALSGHRWEP